MRRSILNWPVSGILSWLKSKTPSNFPWPKFLDLLCITNSLKIGNPSMSNMAAQPVCVDRETLLNVMQVAAAEGNEQL